MVDVKLLYTKSMEVYVGVQPERSYKVSNSVDAIVRKLDISIYGTGRYITIDNWFIIIDLVLDMIDHSRYPTKQPIWSSC